MKDVVISVEDISKQYRLGSVGTGTLSHDLNRWWHTVRGKEDPFLKIGEENNRATKGNSDYVWALKDINFEIKEGEVLGIIGRNGAGKSTLLKILSRTTTPSTGNVKVRGRIASLLEVGTGFHPELTGEENIYLNGAILGMTKREIKNKFDEIVDFAGVEKYINTPVKRYSSGMYVRLAFGVAAHLEPEILIVDEVLAVGDAEFQKKALGKMKDVSASEGRTVLFVSHNMAAISNLCTHGVVLENGTLKQSGDIKDSINYYLKNTKQNNFHYINKASKPDKIDQVEILSKSAQQESFGFDEEISVQIKVTHSSKVEGTHVGISVLDNWHKKVFTDIIKIDASQLGKGNSTITAHIPSRLLLAGVYYLDAALFVPRMYNFDYVSDACIFEIEDFSSEFSIYNNIDIGNVYVKFKWEIN